MKSLPLLFALAKTTMISIAQSSVQTIASNEQSLTYIPLSGRWRVRVATFSQFCCVHRNRLMDWLEDLQERTMVSKTLTITVSMPAIEPNSSPSETRDVSLKSGSSRQWHIRFFGDAENLLLGLKSARPCIISRCRSGSAHFNSLNQLNFRPSRLLTTRTHTKTSAAIRTSSSPLSFLYTTISCQSCEPMAVFFHCCLLLQAFECFVHFLSAPSRLEKTPG